MSSREAVEDDDEKALLSNLDNLRTLIKKQFKEVKEKEDLCKKTIAERDEIRSELQQSLEDKKQLEQKLTTRKTNESELHRLHKQLKEIETENDRLVKELANIKRGSQKSGSEATLRDKLDAKNKLIQKLNTECDELKTRLSRMMGQKLLDGNPDIADLSDKNRPTKLGERYAELYDNQWTDAFEIVETKVDCKDDDEKEKECVRILLKILMASKKFCDDEAKMQDDEIKGAFLRTGMKEKHISFTKDMIKQLKDIKKAVAPDAVDIVYKKCILQTGKVTLREKMTHRLTEYVKECVSICWLMTMQDPPIVLGPNVEPGDPFNKSHYREYTCSGKKIDFVVWPPLLLHVNGPVLAKGVAQGLKLQTREDATRDRTISATSQKSSPKPTNRKQDTDFEVDSIFKSETRSTATTRYYGQSSKKYDLGVADGYAEDDKIYATNYDRDFKGSTKRRERDAYDRNHRRSISQQEYEKKGTTADVINRWRQNHSSSALDGEYDRNYQKEYKPQRYNPSQFNYKLYLNYVSKFGHATAKAALGDELYYACVSKERGYSYA